MFDIQKQDLDGTQFDGRSIEFGQNIFDCSQMNASNKVDAQHEKQNIP